MLLVFRQCLCSVDSMLRVSRWVELSDLCDMSDYDGEEEKLTWIHAKYCPTSGNVRFDEL